MAVNEDDVQKIARESAQKVLEGLHRYSQEYKEPSSVEEGLMDSMVEERTAADWYRRRGATADPDTKVVYQDVAVDEDEHYDKFKSRLEQIKSGEASPPKIVEGGMPFYYCKDCGMVSERPETCPSCAGKQVYMGLFTSQDNAYIYYREHIDKFNPSVSTATDTGFIVSEDRQGNYNITRLDKQGSVFLQAEADKNMVHDMLNAEEQGKFDKGWPVNIMDTEPRASTMWEIWGLNVEPRPAPSELLNLGKGITVVPVNKKGQAEKTEPEYTRDEVKVNVWEERDNLSIDVVDKDTEQITITSWSGDEARQMFEDGFFKPGIIHRQLDQIADQKMTESVLDYAEEMGILAKESTDPGKFEGAGSQHLARKLYDITLESGQDEDIGEADTFGWYAFIKNYKNGKSYILSEDSQGFVSYEEFDEAGEADTAWATLQEQWEAFNTEANEEL